MLAANKELDALKLKKKIADCESAIHDEYKTPSEKEWLRNVASYLHDQQLGMEDVNQEEEQERKLLKEIADYESLIRKGCKSELEKAAVMKRVSDLVLELETMRMVTKKTDDGTEGACGDDIGFNSCDGLDGEHLHPKEHSDGNAEPPHAPCGHDLTFDSNNLQDEDGLVPDEYSEIDAVQVRRQSLPDDNIQLDDSLPLSIIEESINGAVDTGVQRRNDVIGRANSFVDRILEKLKGYMTDTGNDTIEIDQSIHLPVTVKYWGKEMVANLHTNAGLVQNVCYISRLSDCETNINDNLLLRVSLVLEKPEATAHYHLQMENISTKENGVLNIRTYDCNILLEFWKDSSRSRINARLSYETPIGIHIISDKDYLNQINGASWKNLKENFSLLLSEVTLSHLQSNLLEAIKKCVKNSSANRNGN